MLSSQMTSVSQASKSPLLLQAATRSPRTFLCVPGCWRGQQQARGFRFGLWSSYLDPNLQKAIQRRNRIIKHKYAEALNYKLAWDHSRPLYSTRWGLKGFMCTAWRGQDTRCGHRWANVDESNNSGRNFDRAAVEDVGQNVFDRLFGRQELPTRQNNTNDHNLLNRARHKLDLAPSNPFSANEHGNPEEGVSNRPSPWKDNSMSEAGVAFDLEYDIDPISNRKVYRNSTEKSDPNTDPKIVEIPVKKFRGYRPQPKPPRDYVESTTAYTNGKATKTQKECTNVGVSSALCHQGPDRFDNKHHTLQPSHDKQLPRQANLVGDKLKDYECDESLPPKGYSLAKGSQPFLDDELSRYKPFEYNEPDGLPHEQQDSVARSLSDYDHQYKPFTYNEPDGKSPEQLDPVSEGLCDFDHHYASFAFNEPDGQLKGESKSSESVSGSSSSTREDSSAPASERNVGAKSRLSCSGYSLFNKFSTAETDKEEDLDYLRAADVRSASGKIKESKRDITAEENRRSAMEAAFNKLQASQEHHLDEAAAAQKVKESRQRAVLLKLGEGKLLSQDAQAKSEVDTGLSELDAKIPLSSPPSKSQGLTGNFVRDFPEDFTVSWGTEGSTGKDCLIQKTPKDLWGYETSHKGLELSYQKDMENMVQSAENDYATSITTEEYQKQTGGPSRLQTYLHRSQNGSEAGIQAEADLFAKEPQGLETSYAKEVVQQGETNTPLFVSSYGCTEQNLEPTIGAQDGGADTSNSSAKSEEQHRDQELVREIRDIYESAYGTINCQHRQDHKESLHTPSTNADGQPAISSPWQEASKGAGNVSDAHVAGIELPKEQAAVGQEKNSIAVTSLPGSAAQQPTQYKILAYDPTMQEINVAETTSTAMDSSSALTPAEVLLRLSNPTKFFPHFQPLQAQGYEIVSGSGDVLVFRKVRDADPNSPQGISAGSATGSSLPRPRKVVNPIDGMQSIPQPATGNFASPTGFVNHDLPSEPPFESSIDVRREEPVFSGRKAAWPDDKWDSEPHNRKTRNASHKLLIGAAWVAACSYAVGVVSEFFKTGGSDGKGPVGF